MLIGGLQRLTLIDYPGKIAATLFVQGCNFRCPFCHNSPLVIKTTKPIPEVDIRAYLEARKRFLDAVVISGGEPTLQKDLPDFCKKLKSLGFLVKIDTNGSNPDMLKLLVKEKLVDFIAMDIKTALTKKDYEKTIGTKVNIAKIKKSIDIVKKFKEHEFRTTCVPGLINEKELLSIGKYLKKKGANKTYYLQQFQPHNTLDKSFESMTPYTESELRKFQKTLEPFFEFIGVRT
ncbi:MAG: anaerobic ribonucleoside-triphosphate reductase activating protein [Candidatus Pacearchaeota archaeon]|nr:anaerobic ribonucleoside-triphosphate reductase activating protein [Candidatus Pacearchaeota archaeon]